jgi:uncharacterized membrane protein
MPKENNQKTVAINISPILSLLVSIIYGVVLYFAFTWLAGFSLLYAYFGNLALIIIFLAIDESLIKLAESTDYLKKEAEKLSKKLSETTAEDREKTYRIFQKGLENTVSFKTALYLVYIFILIFSQIININPALVSEDIATFIHANNYSILLLIAFDRLIGQVSKERERMKKISAKLKKHLEENHA